MAPDRVIPLYDLDQSATHLDIIVSMCFIVNGHLDIDILHASLTELVTQWPILSARLTHDKVTNRYALMLPGSFKNGRQPFVFTTAHSETPYPHMPSRRARMNPDMRTRMADFRGPSTPHSTTELLKQPDAPIFQVHVHAFSDVTCIGVHIPHTFADLFGLTHILQAWCSLMDKYPALSDVKLPRVLEGDVVGPFGDPESLYPRTPQEEKVFYRAMNSSATVWGFWETVWSTIWIIFYLLTAKEEPRLIFIPQSVVERYRKETTDQHGEWVSENDVVSALMVKIHLYNRPSSSQPLTLSFIANLRKQIPSLSFPASESVYLHNAMYPMVAQPIPLQDLKSATIPSLALVYRHTILSQRSLSQVAMNVAHQRQAARLGKRPNWGPASGVNFHVTSWGVAKLGEIDFSAAALNRDVDETAGKVRFVGGMSIPPRMARASRSLWSLIMVKLPEGKDGEAGYWCETGAKASAWPEIEKFVESWSA